MKQKIHLISGMLHDPDILFMDEPLNGLDANAVILMKEMITELAHQGKTIFYCSHLMDIVEHEDVFLCVQIIVVIPLCGRTCHHTYTVFLCKSMIEYEVVVPQVGD